MNIHWLKLVLSILLITGLFSACSQTPTYSKEKVEQSIKDLCKNEYNLDVETKIIGSTFGVYIPIEGLVDDKMGLDKDAGEKIEDVALSIHRITMSTDKPLNFYTLTARDTKIPGAEFVLTGSVYDVIRVRLMDISRGEYHKRILRDFRFNPVIIGDIKTRELLQAINQDSPVIQNIKPIFYPTCFIGAQGSQKIDIISMDSKEISAHEAIFYVKTKEYYAPLAQYESYRAIFPPGFDNEYLFLANISLLPNPIKEIVAKYFYSGEEIRQRDLKEIFDNYQDIGYIGIDGLPKKDLTMGWFLCEQIARRIRMLFEEDKQLKGTFSIDTSECEITDKIFHFMFSVNPNEGDNIIFSKIVKLAGMIIHRYSFEDFEGAEFTDTKPNGKSIYLSKEDLEKFRQGQIKIRAILNES